MTEKKPNVPNDVPAEIAWRVKQSELLYKPGEITLSTDTYIHPTQIILESNSLLQRYFRDFSIPHESETDMEPDHGATPEIYNDITLMREFLEKHTRKFSLVAIQGLFNRENPPRVELEADELIELFETANPFKRYSDEEANQAYEVARIVLSMLPENTGLTRPKRPIQTYEWLRSIDTTIESIASGSLQRSNYSRNDLDAQRTLVFFNTGANL